MGGEGLQGRGGKGARGRREQFKKVLKSQGLLKSNFDSSIILLKFSGKVKDFP